MSTAPPPAAEPRVLVVHVNFAVGSALAQRLIECSVVSLASASAAPAVLADANHDVLVLCPYLRGDERDALLARAARLERPPAVVDLSVVDGAAIAQGRPQTAATRTVLAALDFVAA